MKFLPLFALVILATANDRIVIPDKMKTILDEMPEIKESLIAKKLLAREMELERVLEINKVPIESDSIKDTTQLIKVAQSTYNSSSTNYTQPNITYNYTNSNYSQPTSSYTNSTNSTQPNNYYYNTSYPTYNGFNNYVTYDNQSSINNTNSATQQTIFNTSDNTYYDSSSNYSTQQNQTYNNNINQSRIRQRFDQSRVHLKLRNNYYRFDNNNFTQLISYYNQSNHSQNTVVLFNSSAVVQKQTPNEYYLYQNNSLVILNQELDPFGNVVYRSINYDFTIVASKQQGSQNSKQNQEIYGTIVYGYGNLNATYNNQNVESGYGTYNQFNYYNYSNGQISYSQESNQGSIQYQNQGNGNSLSDYSEQFYNSTTSQGNNTHSDSQYNHSYYYEGNANFGLNSSNQSSNYSNYESSLDYSNDYQYVNGVGYSNSNVKISSSSSNGSSSSSNYQGDISSYSQGVSQSQVNIGQDNNIFYQNYTKLNQSSEQQNSNSSFNNEKSSWRNYSTADSFFEDQSRNSIIIDNHTYSHNVSDINQYKSDNHYQSEQYYGGNEMSNGYNNIVYGQANVIRDNNYLTNNINTTVNGTINQFNSTSDNYFGFRNTSSTKDINLEVSNKFQNLAQLRGSKKLVLGSWKEVNQKEFVNSNGLIVQEARQAITNKFNPEQEGFQFNSISSIQEQIVSGINYNIKLEYLNVDSTSIIYEVVLYTIPWANQPNQIISCSRCDQSEI